MPFSPEIKQEALLRSKRSCCICNEFAGLFTNVHHILQEADQGPNILENAIVLCLRCHGEVGHYNTKHPIGDKYSVEEVRRHRDQWWDWCKSNYNSPPPKHPILVSPYNIAVVTDGHIHRCNCKVRNNTDQYYYDVWVQFSFDTNDLELAKVKITEHPSSVQSYSFLKEGDMVHTGCAGKDELGNPSKWRVLYEIGPRTERNFNFEVMNPELLCGDSHAVCNVSVIHYDISPGMVVTEGDGRINVKWQSRAYAADALEWEFKDTLPRAVSEEISKVNAQVMARIASDFDVVFAIHTSARTIQRERHSVATMAILEIIKKHHSPEAKITKLETRINMFGAILRGVNMPGNQNYWMWQEAIEKGIKDKFSDYSDKLRVGLIVDTGKAKIDAINARSEPIREGFFLPQNFTLLYTDAEADIQHLPTRLIQLCSREAEMHLDAISRGVDENIIYTRLEGSEQITF